MQEIRRRKAIWIDVRARLPLVARVLALIVLVAGIIFVAVSYYRLRNNKPFVMQGGAPQLSTREVGKMQNYEQRVTEGDRLKLLLRANLDVTYDDGHHELQDVHLEIYP